MEAEEAWDMFKAQASADLRKSASVAGQLDTLAAQMQDIQTGVSRLTTLIPKLMGDETAIDAANAEAAPEPGPEMGEDEGSMPEEDFGPPMGDEEPEEGDILDEEAPEEDDDMSKADDEKPEDIPEETPEDEPAPEAPAEGDDDTSLLDEEPPAEDTPSEEPVEETITEDVEMPEVPEEPSGMDIYAQILALLVQAASKASQSGDADAMTALTKSAKSFQTAYGDLAPSLDRIFGTDTFTKSYNESVSLENELNKSCDSGDLTGANHPDEMIEKSDVPAEVTDSPTDLEKCGTKMPDVEDEKGKTETDSTKVGPVNMEKSSAPQLRSFADIMKSGNPSPFMMKGESIGDALDEHVRTGKKLEDAGIDDEGMEMKKSETSAKMPDVPENGSDKSATGTAGENMPDVPENGSDMSVTGSKSTGVKPVIDPGSEKSELQKSTDSTPAQMDECGGAMAKSAMPGKHLMSMREMMGMTLQKSQSAVSTPDRPDCIYSAGGDVRTPEFGEPLKKSANRMGSSFRELMNSGVTPEEFVSNDWKQYNLFKAQGRY